MEKRFNSKDAFAGAAQKYEKARERDLRSRHDSCHRHADVTLDELESNGAELLTFKEAHSWGAEWVDDCDKVRACGTFSRDGIVYRFWFYKYSDREIRRGKTLSVSLPRNSSGEFDTFLGRKTTESI